MLANVRAAPRVPSSAQLCRLSLARPPRSGIVKSIAAKEMSPAPVSWPPGPLPVVALCAMVSGCAGAFSPWAATLPVIKQTLAVGVKLFGSVAAVQWVMGAACVAHVIESCFTIYICKKNKVPLKDTLGWIGMTLLIGYGGIYGLNLSLEKQRSKVQ